MLISVPTTVLVVVVGALAGYAFAWLDFPGRETVFLVVVALLVVPVQIGLLPVGKPAMASLAIFQFLWVWNDMLVALLFADSSSQPLTVELHSQIRQFGSNIDVLAPGAFLSLVVPVVVFFAFQRHFVQGVMAGSVK